ncbi:hypothetical protein K1719_014346 [Acacia pycnantha]|nr:hypothetical protein K1719_014346 [Acacia pycnantha]
MDERLLEAARVGDVMALHRIMEQDPDILESACSVHFADSPLHVPARRGKAEFMKQIVTRLPSLATETNQQGMIPLHLASLNGHVETVRELLNSKLDEEVNQCLLKDDEGWTSLHCASQKGKIGVIKELIRTCPQCLEQVTENGETVLHVAVKANQVEAVKVLVDSIKHHNFHNLLKAHDQKGKSAYQLAAAKTLPTQVVEVLKEDDYEIREERHINIEGEGNEDSEASNKEDQKMMSSNERQSRQDAILVVATLIITLTYQGLANPPTTLFKDGSTKIDWGCLSTALRNRGLQSLTNELKKCPSILTFAFLSFNTLIFLQSIYIVVLALRGVRILLAVQVLTVDFSFLLVLKKDVGYIYKAYISNNNKNGVKAQKDKFDNVSGHISNMKEELRELLKAKLDDEVNQCLLKDDEGWTSLHCASQKGKIDVIEELIRTCPQCLEQVTEKGETVLHVAVKANQFEAVKVLADSIMRHNFHNLLKAQDRKGKTAYQLAAAKSQVVEVLKEDDEIREERHINIEGEGNEDSEASNKEDQKMMSSNERKSPQDAKLVVATLIITLTYQALANPPITLFKAGSNEIDWRCLFSNRRFPSLKTALKGCPAMLSFSFLTLNTLIFVQSIYIVVSALRGTGRILFPVQLLTVYLIICYSILLTAISYNIVYFSVPFVIIVLLAFFWLSRKDWPTLKEKILAAKKMASKLKRIDLTRCPATPAT